MIVDKNIVVLPKRSTLAALRWIALRHVSSMALTMTVFTPHKKNLHSIELLTVLKSSKEELLMKCSVPKWVYYMAKVRLV